MMAYTALRTVQNVAMVYPSIRYSGIQSVQGEAGPLPVDAVACCEREQNLSLVTVALQLHGVLKIGH
jgi:hypothetical protein